MIPPNYDIDNIQFKLENYDLDAAYEDKVNQEKQQQMEAESTITDKEKELDGKSKYKQKTQAELE